MPKRALSACALPCLHHAGERYERGARRSFQREHEGRLHRGPPRRRLELRAGDGGRPRPDRRRRVPRRRSAHGRMRGAAGGLNGGLGSITLPHVAQGTSASGDSQTSTAEPCAYAEPPPSEWPVQPALRPRPPLGVVETPCNDEPSEKLISSRTTHSSD